MTTIEKIKAEIERQMKFYDEKEMKAWDDSEQGDEDALWYQGHRKMCAKLLTFLSTLEDEKPVPNDLEEAADNHIREVVDAAGHPGWDWEKRDIKEAFIAGAKWQKEQDMEEWLKDRDGCFWDGVNEGKKAMREQMMKEAVEVQNVVEEGRYCQEIGPIFLDERAGFKPGDKVRIFVLKKEVEE